MYRITALIGSPRKEHSYRTSMNFLEKLASLSEIEYELVQFSDYNLKTCNGCKLCMDKGEELCPLKDDRDIIIEKMKSSDGIVFVSPNYSFHVSAHMKIFLDRLGFLFHRPRLFGKASTSIVVQGIYGGSKILKYFRFIGNALGMRTCKGITILTLEPMTEKAVQKMDSACDKLSRRFLKTLKKPDFPNPTLFDLMMFRVSRSSMKNKLTDEFRDYSYYKDMGWFESDFYYPVKLTPLKRVMGKLFDSLGRTL
ncbi:MAG: NAD(P)H-dependent oxidoreductase [Spirochaetales bacterium]|nr:NAD(P)H-dependent oxidoreductase [Spirochaetales bacterium]